MSVLFVGAMPWVQLFQRGQRTGWASVVAADWTPHGPGRCIALRRADRWRVVGTNRAMFDWLCGWYLRPAMEDAGEPWRLDPFEHGDVELSIDLDSGLRAAGGGIEVEMSHPIDRQLIRRDRYPLGDFQPTASWVRVVCAGAGIVDGGEAVAGEPTRGSDSYGPRSTAQINVAEVWTD